MNRSIYHYFLFIVYFLFSVSNLEAEKNLVKGPSCTVTAVSKTQINIGLEGGAVNVIVTSYNNCTSYGITTPSWVSWDRTDQTVTLNIEPNTGSARAGYVYIGSIPVNISQAGCTNPGAAQSITGSSTVCMGQSGVSYTVPVIANATSYTWNYSGTGAYINGTGNSVTINFASNATSGVLTVRGVNNCGVSGTSSPGYNITVGPVPSKPTISANGPTTFCENGSVTLTSSPEYSYYWSNDATSQSVQIANSGSYSVTVINSYGCASTASNPVNITVNRNPSKPTITASGATTFCSGGSVTLTSSAGASSVWSNGATGSSIVVSNTGSYSVQAKNANSCTSIPSDPISLTVNPLPSFTVSYNQSVCDGSTLYLTGPGGMSSYAWTGPSYFTSTSQNPSIENATIDYSYGRYTLTAKNSYGCQNSSYVDVIINEVPNISATYTGLACDGNSITLSTTDGLSNYSWTGPHGFTSANQNPGISNASPSISGLYTVSASNSAGCRNSAQTLVTIYPKPAITISSSPVCEDNSLGIDATSGMTSYAWTGPNGFSSSNEDLYFPTPSPDLSGTYSLAVVDGHNCSNSTSTQVTVNPKPSVVLQKNKTVYEGTPLILSGTPNMSSYAWAGPNYSSNAQDAIVASSSTPAMSGTYTLTVTNGSGCSSTGSMDVVVNAFDKSLPVGSVSGGVNVSASGAATYQIPIFTSPGTGGMAPSLSVVYNSQAGNGLLGKSWNLQGLSSINRLPQNIRDDGQVKAVQLASGDLFGLDGNRLVVTNNGVYGANGTEYHTQAETFVKVTSYGSSGSGPRWFKVETKDGKTIEYGNSATSYLQASNKDEIIFWYISKITDANGNYMTFTYYTNRSTGEFWPVQIDYTGNTNTGLAPYNTINFAYQPRPDITTSYVGGSGVTYSVLLNKIQTVSEGTTIREYNFSYSQDGAPQLNQVVEFGKNHTKINTTIFNWSDCITHPNSFETELDAGYSYIFDDFNGNGKKEAISSNNKHIYELNSTNTGLLDLGSSGLPGNLNGYKTGDFNGDGKSDIIVPLTSNSNSFAYYQSNGNGFTLIGNYGSAATSAKELYPGDYNGDGLIDVVMRNPADNALTIFWGNSTAPFSNSSQISTITWGNKQFFADFNGDGKPEIMTLDGNGYRIYECQNSVFQLTQSNSTPTDAASIYIGDFNGDGKRDFIYRRLGPNFYVCISTGINFVVTGQSLSGVSSNVWVYDINGDGRDEFIANNSSYGWQNNSLVLTGSNVVPPLGISFLEDFDGDGLVDSLVPDLANNTGPMSLVFSFNNAKEKAVSSIVNGFKNTTSITYKHLTDNSVHTLSSDGAYRTVDFASSVVVSSVAADNGMGGQNVVDYHYAGGKYDNRDKQFLGFASVSQTNNTAGLVSTSYYDIDRTYYFSKPVRSEVKTTSGTLLTEASYSTTVRDFGGNRLFVYRSGETSTDHLHGNATSSSSVVYNDDGNPASSTSNAGGISTSATTNTFVAAGPNAWCPNKLLTATTTLTRTGEPNYTTVTNFNYYPNGLLQQEIKEPGNAKQLYTNYSYDSFGNVTQMKVSSDGITGRVTNLQYELGKGRMVTRRSNALNHYIDFTNDYALGVVTQTVDNNNLTTTYQYDNFGKLLSTTNPDGTASGTSINWVTGSGAPQNAIYYTTAQASGVPPVTTYFDALGRQLQSETTGFDGRKILTKTAYTTKGQVDYVTLPYYEGEASTDRKSYTYDALGRVVTETAPGLNLTYTYNGLVTTVTNNLTGQSTTKTMDASGALVQSSDAGGTISYTYNAMGQARQVTSPSGSSTIEYDQFGRQISLTDPNTGKMTYDYNVYGELTSQNDPLNNSVSLKYDDIGRVYKRTENSLNTDWNYKTNGQLDNVTTNSGIKYTYSYDDKGRPWKVTETESNVFKTDFYTSCTYNSNGQVSTTTYPSGFAVEYVYQNGYLQEIRRVDDGSHASIWKLNAVNAKGQATQTTAGNGMVTTKAYDNRGLIQSIVTQSGTNIVQSLGYSFDAKGYLECRKDNKRNALTESFGYDNLGRLNSITTNGVAKSIAYADNGNISSKSDAGTYAYSASHPNAVETLSDNKGMVSSLPQDITYTSFSMPATIAENGVTNSFTYGPEHERKIMTTTAIGGLTKYYSGSYERQLSGSITRELHYITANGEIVAIFEKKTGAPDAMHYVHTDHLGSLNVITSATGTIEQETSYDAWGNRRDPATLVNYATTPANLVTDRGFTGHEHLDAFKLINMNGRVYDPTLGRFLSPDNYVQAPDFTQSYNRYSYCMNNPLSFTDPSGMIMYRDLPEAENCWTYAGNSDITFSSGRHSLVYGGGGGSQGYIYDNARNVYMDIATGRTVSYEVATNYLINRAARNGELHPVDPKDLRKVLDEIKEAAGPEGDLKTTIASGGITGILLDVIFNVSGIKASGLQIIQTYYGSRGTNGVIFGTYHWVIDGVNYDGLVDGGKNSPYVTISGNPPADPTNPYYLTPSEVASQVTWNGTSGSIRMYDNPTAVFGRDVSSFETIIVATNYNGSGVDKVLGAFQWGWTSYGTKPITNGIILTSYVPQAALNIIKHDYPNYKFK